MENKKGISWFSCGITSAVACKLAIEKYSNIDIVYIKINSAHKHNEKFINQCENWYQRKIIQVQSSSYKDQFDVIEKTRYINGPYGARCTKELKKEVRYQIEQDYDYQVFGFDYSRKDINRAIRFKQQYKYTNPKFPLIESMITKNHCAYILEKNGIDLPEMYKLGYSNNNCIGCVKGGKGYWNKIRKDFPKEFEKMKDLENKIGHSCIKGTFLKDLKENEGRYIEEIIPDCGNFCDIELENVISPLVDKIINNRIKIIDI